MRFCPGGLRGVGPSISPESTQRGVTSPAIFRRNPSGRVLFSIQLQVQSLCRPGRRWIEDSEDSKDISLAKFLHPLTPSQPPALTHPPQPRPFADSPGRFRTHFAHFVHVGGEPSCLDGLCGATVSSHHDICEASAQPREVRANACATAWRSICRALPSLPSTPRLRLRRFQACPKKRFRWHPLMRRHTDRCQAEANHAEPRSCWMQRP
jgi:hypothetical protein